MRLSFDEFLLRVFSENIALTYSLGEEDVW
jgi:hypothetical protein